jgi:RNA polymerase sigma-70 factor (family 1)
MSYQEFHSDEELITRLSNNDLSAFDELYWKYQKAVFQNVYKLTHQESIAEDIVQDVFISLWEKRHSIDVSRGVAGWLFVSSYNRAVNVLKKSLRESLAIKDSGNIDISSDPIITEIQYTILEKAIVALPPQKRKVFELCKLQGHTYDEAAKEMNISKHTVKEYMMGAMHAIRDYAARYPESGAAICILLVFCSI